MNPTRRSALVLLLVTAALLGGCSRAVSVGSDTSVAYAVEVRNTLAVDMIVSYDDGSGAHALGAVQGGRTERFIVASPRTTAVTISARNASGTRVSGPFPVQLQAGQTQRVDLR
jgi:hypothetical protein